jgi:dTDP-4-dehydrorhamnose 3,5-epimerase
MDDTEMMYLVDEFFSPVHERVIRYNDQKFALRWPAAPAVISDKDRNQADFDPTWHLAQRSSCT